MKCDSRRDALGTLAGNCRGPSRVYLDEACASYIHGLPPALKFPEFLSLEAGLPPSFTALLGPEPGEFLSAPDKHLAAAPVLVLVGVGFVSGGSVLQLLDRCVALGGKVVNLGAGAFHPRGWAVQDPAKMAMSPELPAASRAALISAARAKAVTEHLGGPLEPLLALAVASATEATELRAFLRAQEDCARFDEKVRHCHNNFKTRGHAESNALKQSGLNPLCC